MIYTVSDVKRACNDVLSTAFDGTIKIYGNDTLDGYERPSFFTEILPHGRKKQSRFLTQTGFTYRITYFERTHDEPHCLSVYGTICEAFGRAVRVSGHTRICVNSIDFAWIDENADKMQVTISFHDSIEIGGYEDEHDIMESLELNYESEEM